MIDESKIHPDVMGFLNEFHKEYIEELRIASGIEEDWNYQSAWTTHDNWEKYIDVVGEENIKFISASQDTKNKTDFHFTIFVSPQGRENAVKYIENQGI